MIMTVMLLGDAEESELHQREAAAQAAPRAPRVQAEAPLARHEGLERPIYIYI